MFAIRLYKNNIRISPGRLNVVDARLLFKLLKDTVITFKQRYGKKLSDKSILLIINKKISYHRKNKLESVGINTIQDLIDYLELGFPISITIDYIPTEDKNTLLNKINVLIMEFV